MEALILSLAGGFGGVLLGVWGLGAAYALIPGVPALEFPLGWHLLPVSLGLILGTALLVGGLPAIRFSRPELVSSLKEGAGGGGRRVGRIHRVAASSQAGLALSLVVVSGLFVRAVDALHDKDLGFEPAGLITSRMDLSGVGIESSQEAAIFLEDIKAAVETVPGVERVSFGDGHPVDLVANFTSVSRLDGPEDQAYRPRVEFTRVGEGYFETVGTPILRGRGILPTDDLTSEPVVVITETLANHLWQGEDPVGRRVSSGFSRTGPEVFTVVGIVADVASSRPTESWPNVFFSLAQAHDPRVMVMVRASSDPRSLYRPVREALLSVEPDLPYPVVLQAQSVVDRAGDGQRMSAAAAGGLGALAILLAAIGIYGVVAFAVSRRSREIGLRMALGAGRRTVLLEVLRDGLRLAVPGLLVGALLAGGSAAGFRTQLHGLSPMDPVSFVVAGSVIFLVILLASFFPARKASGIDPMNTLRQE
jgi:predicted permease